MAGLVQSELQGQIAEIIMITGHLPILPRSAAGGVSADDAALSPETLAHSRGETGQLTRPLMRWYAGGPSTAFWREPRAEVTPTTKATTKRSPTRFHVPFQLPGDLVQRDAKSRAGSTAHRM
jgi:hypothetical protein